MLSKILCMINCLPKSMLLVLGHQELVPTSVTKIQFDSDNQDLEKKIEDFNKKIPNNGELVNRLIVTQNLQRLKTRY